MTQVAMRNGALGLSLSMLLLALAGFGATTLLLSQVVLMNDAETFMLTVSPRTLVGNQEFLSESTNGEIEDSHGVHPWRNIRRTRGAAKREFTKTKQETSRTIETPCGALTQIHSRNIPTHCSGYALPFTTAEVPKECWPRIFLLPSYPTSGNELVHIMFQRITGLISFNSVKLGQPAFDLSTPDHTGLTMYFDDKELCSSSSNLAMPVAGQVMLSKNHYRNQRGGPDPNMFQRTSEQQTDQVPGGIDGVVRLARNPGDHLLRNFFRWDNRDCHGDDCFFKRAKTTCKILESKAYDWNQFHNYWNNYDSSVPQLVMYYERFSNRATTYDSFREMMTFVGAEEAELGTMNQKVQDFVREPTYEQGGLVAKVCGVKVARRVNALTKEHSERLGYDFDNERGVWTLDTKNIPLMVS